MRIMNKKMKEGPSHTIFLLDCFPFITFLSSPFLCYKHERGNFPTQTVQLKADSLNRTRNSISAVVMSFLKVVLEVRQEEEEEQEE